MYTFTAFALLLIPFALTLCLTLADPTVGRVILPAGELVDKIEQGQSWMEIAPWRSRTRILLHYDQ